MDLLKFVEDFTDIIPFDFEVYLGESRKSSWINPNENNYKGREFKTGLGGYTSPENLTRSIRISIKSSENLIPYFKETAAFANRESTSHTIEIFDVNQAQVGALNLDLTPAGDIKKKVCVYNRPDDKYRIIQTVYNDFVDGKIIRREEARYIKKQEFSNETLIIDKTGGIVTGVSLRLKDELEEVTSDFSRSVFDEPDYEKRKRALRPSAIANIEKICSFNDFEGEYLGSALMSQAGIREQGMFLYVYTKKGDHNLYTRVFLEGINPDFETDNVIRPEDEKWLKRIIEKADKTPTYDTQTLEGMEILVRHDGRIATSKDEKEFERFKGKYIDMFTTAPEIIVEKVLQKSQKKSNQ